MRLVATISDNLQPLLDDQAEAISTALCAAGLEKAWRHEVSVRSVHQVSTLGYPGPWSKQRIGGPHAAAKPTYTRQ
jgi:hypothetical protein